MKKTALLSWHLFVDCDCGELLDLADHDEDRDFSPIFNNKWDEIEGGEVICPKCDAVIVIEKVEY